MSLSGFSSGPTANYRFAEENELARTVLILGAIQKPGRYEIARNLDLMDLIALAGGWTEAADLDEIRISRIVETKDGISRSEAVLDLSDSQDLPLELLGLQDGDVVSVAFSSGWSIVEVASVVSAVAIAVTAYAAMMSVTK